MNLCACLIKNKQKILNSEQIMMRMKTTCSISNINSCEFNIFGV